jgi:hypothetical protein
MFEEYFFFQNLVKRFPKALLGVVATAAIVFLVWRLWPEAEMVYVLIGVAGAAVSIFYLLGGVSLAIGGMALVGLAILFEILDGHWVMLLILGAVLLGLFYYRKHNRRLKREMRESNPDLSEEQIAEIIATKNSVQHNNALPQHLIDVSFTARFGFLLTDGKKRGDVFLLAPNEYGIMFYRFDSQKRMEEVIAGSLNIPAHPDDEQVYKEEIENIRMFQKKLFAIQRLWIEITYIGEEGVGKKKEKHLIAQGISTRQVEEFFLAFGDTIVDNQVSDYERFSQGFEIADQLTTEIEGTEPEIIARRYSARKWNRFMLWTSFLSMSMVILGIMFYQEISYIPFAILLLWPAIVTTFLIHNQEFVEFGGSKKGKPSISTAYLWNPLLSGGVTWYIVLFIIECTCLARRQSLFVVGALGAVIFFLCAAYFTRRISKSIWLKLWLLIISLAFGVQITGILLLEIHL